MVHRRRRRYRRRYRRVPGGGGFAAVAVGVGIGLAALAGHLPPGTGGRGRRAPGKAAAAAIAFARQQIGQPYLWGGTGPGGFDCSGLVMMAYRPAGITSAHRDLPRPQWTGRPARRSARPQPGDLVFFAGADGTGFGARPRRPGGRPGPAPDDRRLRGRVQSVIRDDRPDGLPGSAPGLADPVGVHRPGGGAAMSTRAALAAGTVLS